MAIGIGVAVLLLMLFAFRAGKEENAPPDREKEAPVVAEKEPAATQEEQPDGGAKPAAADPPRGLRIAKEEEEQSRKAAVLAKEEEDRVERERRIDADLAQWSVGNRFEGDVENVTTGLRTPIVLTVVSNQGRGEGNSAKVMLRAEGDRPGQVVLLEGKYGEYRGAKGSKSRFERYRQGNLNPSISFVRVFVPNRPRRRPALSFFDPSARFTLTKNDQRQIVGEARHRYKRDQTEKYVFRPTAPEIGIDLKRQWAEALTVGSVLGGLYEEPKRALQREQSLTVRCEVQEGKREEERRLVFSSRIDSQWEFAEYVIRLGPERNTGAWYAIGSLQKPSDNRKGRSELLHGNMSRGVPLAMRITGDGKVACLVGSSGSMLLSSQGAETRVVRIPQISATVNPSGLTAAGLTGESRQHAAARQAARDAAAELRTAKMFLRSSKPLVIQKGRERLRALIRDYPSTKFAEEATRLLEGGAL